MEPTLLSPAIQEKDHRRGSLSATIKLVEYGDFECSFCGLAYPQIEKFVKEMGDQVCFVFRHFPLVNSHPHAMSAARAAEAASRQNKFWQMHHLLYRNQASFTEEGMGDFAKMLDLDMERFEKDFNDPALVDHIQRDFNSGVNSGVNGTPTLYLNGRKFQGNATYRELVANVRNLLPRSSEGSHPTF